MEHPPLMMIFPSQYPFRPFNFLSHVLMTPIWRNMMQDHDRLGMIHSRYGKSTMDRPHVGLQQGLLHIWKNTPGYWGNLEHERPYCGVLWGIHIILRGKRLMAWRWRMTRMQILGSILVTTVRTSGRVRNHQKNTTSFLRNWIYPPNMGILSKRTQFGGVPPAKMIRRSRMTFTAGQQGYMRVLAWHLVSPSTGSDQQPGRFVKTSGRHQGDVPKWD